MSDLTNDAVAPKAKAALKKHKTILKVSQVPQNPNVKS